MNIAYILAENQEDSENKQNRVVAYCVIKNIILDKIIIDQYSCNLEIREGRIELCKLFNWRLKNIILVDLNSLGKEPESKLILLHKLKKTKTKLHILDIEFSFGKKDINQIICFGELDENDKNCVSGQPSNRYFFLSIMCVLMGYDKEK